MTSTARGTFEITMTPGLAEVDGAVGRFDFTKTFHGDLDATGAGVMLSGGDPQAGAAGYVAIEAVHGRLAGRDGSFTFQQFGTMHGGSHTLTYVVVPGSGAGDLAGLTGTVQVTVADDGTHSYELQYQV